MSQWRKVIEAHQPRSKPADESQKRMPMSYWTIKGCSPPDSFAGQYRGFLCMNPHHELNHPNHFSNRKRTRYYDGFTP